MRTTIDLPDQLFRQLKATAALRGVKLKDLIRGFVETGLGNEQGESEHSPTRMPFPTFRLNAPNLGPLPSLTQEQVRTIFDEEEARVYLAARKRLEEKRREESE